MDREASEDDDLANIRQQDIENARMENQKILSQMGFDHADNQRRASEQFQAGENKLTREQQLKLQSDLQAFQAEQNGLTRDQQLTISKMQENGQNSRSGAALALQKYGLDKKGEKTAADQMFGVYQSSKMIIAGIDPSTGRPIPANTPEEKKALAVYKAKANEQVKSLTPTLTEMGLLKTGKPAETLTLDQVRYKMENAKTDEERTKYQAMLGGGY
ncbi:hypothetical protein [Deefgea sp. CFH1-16]|uniref:hypothetical protein n=1 Tax=Deefgea sp. CFH1-16 TaxID=2675457 RepID=UPI0015F4E0C3|nr:hypothetical protein [Deefgea sp. CFH1-16]MBM5575841.1 hypothetical protein [Deefgea sp. CFH1-16]